MKSIEELAIEIVNGVFNKKIDIVNARQLSFVIVNAFSYFPKRIMELEKNVCDANKGAEINFKGNELLVDKKIELDKKIRQLESQIKFLIQALKDIRNVDIPSNIAVDNICSIIDSALKNVKNDNE